MEVFGVVNSSFFSTDFKQNNYHGYWMNAALSGNLGLGFGGGAGNCDASNKRVKNTIGHLQPNIWNHIAGIVRSATDMTIYVNCNDALGSYNGTGSSTPAYSLTPGRIGTIDASTSNDPNYFWGIMDDFAFWDRELSNVEIINLCNDTVGTILCGGSSTNIHNNLKSSIDISHSNDFITVTSQEIGTIALYDLQGRTVFESEFHSTLSITKNTFSTGIYILEFRSKNGNIQRDKILVQ